MMVWTSFPGGTSGKEPRDSSGAVGSVSGSGGPLEKGMETHRSVLAQRIPQTEEPGGLQSIGLHRLRHG